ncbi:MAG TPA: PEP/pyruvate-binding domain-containing protein [Ktedonobacteraceae bacterium]|nr:PEP/pyruvate-binding domain-containing protein [Ktedonobacteraceae bacterium]
MMSSLLPNDVHSNYILNLTDIRQGDVERAGAKAAKLGELAQAAFPVPDSFVLTTSAFDRFLIANAPGPEISPEAVIGATLPTDIVEALLVAANALGDVPLAVRSSGTAEDLPGASFAGQYETVLDVRGAEALVVAVRRVFASVFSQHATAYRAAQGQQKRGRMAVLVQRQVEASAAGVAFTANPVTGDLTETVISAVRGSGEQLVSGQAMPDEWIVRDKEAVCRAEREGSIDAGWALIVAALARRVEAHFGGIPQDIEWALAGGELFLLQARPITTLSEPGEWKAPLRGAWARHIRLGEWLGDPLTPLFESWGLSRIEERLGTNQRQLAGTPTPQPMHIVANGWYFCSLSFLPSSPASMLWKLLRHALPKALVHPRRVAMTMPFTAKFGVELFVREWRAELLPRYQALVQQSTSRVDQLNASDLVGLVEEQVCVAGDYFTSITAVAGFAWKAEMPLAAFYRKYLFPRIGGGYQRLLCGLSDVSLVSRDHSVTCLDWFHPTLGEYSSLCLTSPDSETLARPGLASTERLQAEAQARSALAHEPKRLARFEKLLNTAQRFGRSREEQVASLTLGWPLMRRALLRLGGILVEQGVLLTAEDVFFLTRAELLAALTENEPAGSPAPGVMERRKLWQRQRRLTPPLILGDMTPMMKRIFEGTENMLRSEMGPSSGNGLAGLPASPGRASGPARVIRTPEEFDHLQPGDVLIAPVTTPAWTMLFARAAAVVTDTGSPLAHASLAAREYGIPAVVGTGNATARVRDGQWVLIDGNTGLVEVQS